MKKDTIDVVFLGKPRGLSDLAHRQRKPGQWVGAAVVVTEVPWFDLYIQVDNMGVMVLATAHYLKRNIHL